MFGAPAPGDSILMISDGGENASRSKESALPIDLLANGVRLFFCLIWTGEDGPTPEEVAGPVDLQQLSAKTGGLTVEPFRGQSSGDIVQFVTGHPRPPVLAALLTLFKPITNVGLVEVVLPSLVTKRERWTLSFSKEKSRELKGAKLLYPQELLACSPVGSQDGASAQRP
jgi:hypothetical protein